MNPNQINTTQNNLTGANGESSPTFRGPDYYKNLNIHFGPNGSIPTQTPTSLPTNTPPVVPIQVGTGGTAPVNLPPAPTPTAAGGASAQASSYLNQPTITSLGQLGGAAQAAGQNFNTAQGDYVKSASSVADLMTNLRPQLEEQYNIKGLTEARTAANAKMMGLEEQYRQAREAVNVNPNITADMKSARLGEIARKEAFEKSGVALDVAVKEGQWKDAKDLIDRQYEIALEPAKFKMEFYQNMKNDYKDVFNQSQNRLIDNLQKNADRAYQAKRDDAKLLADLKMDVYKQAAKDGKISFTDIGKAQTLEDLAKITGQTVQDIKGNVQAKDTLTTIDKLIGGAGEGYAVGPNALARGGVIRSFVGSANKKDFIAQTDKLLNSLTLQNLIDAKAKGATFGALSEGELTLLANSASGIRAIKDSKGNTTGFDMSEKGFNDAMNTIKKYAVIDYERRTGQKYEDPANQYNGIKLPGVTTTGGSNYLGVNLPH